MKNPALQAYAPDWPLHCPLAMWTWRDSLDDRPGAAPDTRILSDATVLLIFPVTCGVNADDRARLVLRFDRRGSISAALQRHAVSEPSDGTL